MTRLIRFFKIQEIKMMLYLSLAYLPMTNDHSQSYFSCFGLKRINRQVRQESVNE